MTKLLLISLTTLAFTASAVAVFAQDPQTDTNTESEITSSETLETVETEVENTVEDTSEMQDRDSREIQQDMDEMTKKKTKDASSETQTVACPEGTELHEDGNCHVSDDWTPER